MAGRVDQSIIPRVGSVAEDGVLSALAASRPPGLERDRELEALRDEHARLGEALKAGCALLTLGGGKVRLGTVAWLGSHAGHRVNAPTKARLLRCSTTACDAGRPRRRACGELEINETPRMAVVAPHGYKYKPVIPGRSEGTREGAMMQHRLPSNLSPKAKRLLLTADSRQTVRALVQVAPSADVSEIEQRIGAVGGTSQSLMRDTHLLSLDVPAGQLGELAGIDGVVYVEAGEAYGT